jgi:two-component sensor histidine kinase
MRINKLLLIFFFSIGFYATPSKLLANELDSLIEIVLQKQVHEEEANIDFSAIFFDVESKMPNNIEEANAYEQYILKGMKLYNQGKYLAALSVFNNLSDHELYRNKDEEMLVNYYLGICFNRLGNLPVALFYLEKMIYELEEHPISGKKLHQLYSSYASMKLSENKISESMQYFKKCLQISKEVQDSLLLCRSYNNIGVGYMEQKKYDSALYYFNQIQNKAFKKHQAVLHAFGFGNAGAVMQKLGDTAASIPLLYEEVKLLKEQGTKEGLFNCYMGIGRAYEQQNKTDSAISYFKKALKTADKTQNRANKVNAFEAILGLKIAKKDFSDILNLYESYLEAQKERQEEFQLNNIQSIQQLSKIVDISRKSLTKKNEIKTLSLQKQRLIYLIISLCLLVVLLFVIISYNIKSRKKIQEKNAQHAEKNQALKDSFVTISKTNRQNELLLREVHHRVKNNLQMLISMFNLQKNTTNDVKLREILNQAQDRLLSIALVHQNVYQNNDFEFIDLKSYIENLISSLNKDASTAVEINLQVESIDLNISKVIPIGLILCELITNSLKHAKPTAKALQINLSAILKEDTLVLAYNDNGSFDKGKGIRKSDSSIGLTLIELFAEQLNAKLEFNHLSAIKGFHCRIGITIFEE